MQKKLYPNHHPDKATSLQNLGASYGKIDKERKALECYEEAQKERKQLFPKDCSEVATSLYDVGMSYGKLGEHRQALKYKKEALEMQKRLYAEDHPDLRDSLHSIGVSYCRLNEEKEGLKWFQKEQESIKKFTPNDHLRTGKNLYSIGVGYESLGDLKQASVQYEQAITEILSNKQYYSFLKLWLDDLIRVWSHLTITNELHESKDRLLNLYKEHLGEQDALTQKLNECNLNEERALCLMM